MKEHWLCTKYFFPESKKRIWKATFAQEKLIILLIKVFPNLTEKKAYSAPFISKSTGWVWSWICERKLCISGIYFVQPTCVWFEYNFLHYWSKKFCFSKHICTSSSEFMNPFFSILKKLTHATAFLGTFFIVAHTHIVGPIPCCKVELFMRKNVATFIRTWKYSKKDLF